MSDTEPSAKRARPDPLAHGVVSKDLEEAASKLEKERDENRRRAARFGLPYVEPNIFRVVPVGDAKRLLMQKDSGLVTGFDVADDAERAKAAKRAEKFGVKPFEYETAVAQTAGLSEDALALRKARRERAKKFGKEDELDVLLAKAAAEALGVVSNPEEELAAPRPNVLHVRSYGYIPASTADLMEYFKEFRPAFIEWLNGVSVNVVFGDEHSAKRALLHYSEAIPKCAGVPEVDAKWRVCLKPLVKTHTDRYAPKGTETTLYARVATTLDTKEHAKATGGPRTHGTYSKTGAYSKRSHGTIALPAEAGDVETLLAEGAPIVHDGGVVASSAVGVLTGAAKVTSKIKDLLNQTAEAYQEPVASKQALVSGSKRRRSEVTAPLPTKRIIRIIHNDVAKPDDSAALEVNEATTVALTDMATVALTDIAVTEQPSEAQATAVVDTVDALQMRANDGEVADAEAGNAT